MTLPDDLPTIYVWLGKFIEIAIIVVCAIVAVCVSKHFAQKPFLCKVISYPMWAIAFIMILLLILF